MTTVFTRASVRDVEHMGYEAVKIASYDCRSYPLLRDVRERWGRVFLSTGASYDEEIKQAAKILEGVELSLLHCVTIYPTPLSELHLRRMVWLRRYSDTVGFSDHTLVERDGILGAKAAMALGVDVVERHFTILDADQSRDGPVSIMPDQLAELRAFADTPRRERMKAISAEQPDWTVMLGEARRRLSEHELRNRDYYAGRVASRIGNRQIYNWEDVDIDAPLEREALRERSEETE